MLDTAWDIASHVWRGNGRGIRPLPEAESLARHVQGHLYDRSALMGFGDGGDYYPPLLHHFRATGSKLIPDPPA